jgi:hypothetical protein
MYPLLLKFGSWLGQKLIVAGLIVLLALAGYGVWLFVQDESGAEVRRLERLQRTMVERDQLQAVRATVERRIAALRTEVETQQARVKQASKVIELLRGLESWWERWFGNSGQQAANVEQVKRLETLQTEATGRLAELQKAVTQVQWEKDGVELALQRVEREVGSIEAGRSKVRLYLHEAWDKTKWYLAVALGSYFLGPTLWALTMYYGFARWITRGRPIRLGADPAALPLIGESRVSIEAVLRTGEILRIKEKFLQASDEGIGKQTRFVLDWRIPFTSAACGLIELVELRPGPAMLESRVTLSNGDDPHIELAMVDVPASASLVLRPSFLAGVVQRDGETLEIRRHWRLLHWQAWVTGQFRFFEFVGPCRLVVSGSRGVRAEQLVGSEGQPAPARRTNQDATIGFTPNLRYRPVRAETFWSYYRGMNPLFDDLFAGRGLFILQETASGGPAGKAGRFWSSVWNGVLKVFGL